MFSEPYCSVCGKCEGEGGMEAWVYEKQGFFFFIIDVKIRGVAQIRVRKFFISVLPISN